MNEVLFSDPRITIEFAYVTANCRVIEGQIVSGNLKDTYDVIIEGSVKHTADSVEEAKKWIKKEMENGTYKAERCVCPADF